MSRVYVSEIQKSGCPDLCVEPFPSPPDRVPEPALVLATSL